MGLKLVYGPFGSFDRELSEKVVQLFDEENLLQAILHCHLLLEQALLNKIKSKLARPNVFEYKKFSGLSFAQKITLYIGLYNPEKDTERYLLAFNKMRNMIAHQLIEPEEAIEKCLRPAIIQHIREIKSDHELSKNPRDILTFVFTMLIFMELGAIHGLERDDKDFIAKPVPNSKVKTNSEDLKTS